MAPAADVAKVLRYFFKCEASRTEYSERSREILAWCDLVDEQVLERARCFARERSDTNPVLAYTVGTPRADYSRQIGNWTRVLIDCTRIYTCGIGDEMTEHLDAVGGNVRDFALSVAKGYPEFTRERALSPDKMTIIVVAQERPRKTGTYELLDGAHRLVALCQKGLLTADAYVGQPLIPPLHRTS